MQRSLNNDLPLVLDLDIGVGDHKLDLGDLNMSDITLDAGVGSVFLDLRGTRRCDLSGEIDCGVGELKVKLPSDVGIKIEMDTGVGAIDVSGLTREGNFYMKNFYDTAEFKIELTIDAGVGHLKIDVEK